MYQKTKLDRLEVFALEEQLVLKGVKISRINPKSISKHELIGIIDSKSGLWKEGLLTAELRLFGQDKTSLKKWIHLDGPIDHDWAENLNSVLDDNTKIDLPNGEIIKVNPGTTIIFETDSLRNLTPATISRCGLVHLQRSDTNEAKQIFNQYLNRLPPNLQENVKEIEDKANYLLPFCFQVFNEEKQKGTLVLQHLDEFWIIQSFIKIFDAFMQPYWVDFINGNKADFEEPPQQNALKNCLHAYGYPEPVSDPVA